MNTIKILRSLPNAEYLAEVVDVRSETKRGKTSFTFSFRIVEGPYVDRVLTTTLPPYESYKAEFWFDAILGADSPKTPEMTFERELLIGKKVKAAYSSPKVRDLQPA